MSVLLVTMATPASCTIYKYENLGLTTVPEDLPGDAVVITIKGNNIPVLETDAFVHNRKCLRLELPENHIRQIQPEPFNSLKYLWTLNLDNNNLTRIEGMINI